MIVDDIQNDAQADPVGLVNETPNVIGSAVQPRGSEKIDPIVAPTETPRKIGDRHDFQHRNAGSGELGQLFTCRCPSPFRSKRTNVHFIDDLTFPMNAAPSLIGPRKLARIDNLRTAMRAVGLKSRSGVGNKHFPVIKPVSVQHPGPCPLR